MADFALHTVESAPQEAKERLESTQKQMGFLPNLFAKMAEAPALLEAYQTLDGIYSRTSLTPAQQQVALLAISSVNGCSFCVAAHTGGAQAAKVPEGDIAKLRELRNPDDPKLNAVARFAKHLVEARGWAEEVEMRAFLDAGFEKQQLLELVIAVSLKTLSNFTNHIAGTPLNDELKSLEWQDPRA
ncbi:MULTISPECIES: carboxymuconolactone decarboxylase family protein [Halomonadaceae]|uniref:carboxymuconolactone decarboxylase family protein n=1 Tax=Halomonadaceae TaxID=28256 RepID=UPI001581878C|nr:MULTISPECIES: carboxymuconolactone decarboxylase family protein [Halomonas]MDI4636787.1 carboxymuconolactone decarboxylase family protein [Halomonas sp. BMC7]NUJ61149.1 carboxymuconolactone decarboxylase family protein [Halomonas taeanensis]